MTSWKSGLPRSRFSMHAPNEVVVKMGEASLNYKDVEPLQRPHFGKISGDRSQFFKDLTMPFYGYNRTGAKISEGVRKSFWLQGMMAGFPACYFCIKAFSETDLTEDLKKFDVPTLVLHGDDDQIVPIGDSALLSSKLIKNATLKVYKGAPHGMCTTLKDKVNEDLLAFLKA